MENIFKKNIYNYFMIIDYYLLIYICIYLDFMNLFILLLLLYGFYYLFWNSMDKNLFAILYIIIDLV